MPVAESVGSGPFDDLAKEFETASKRDPSTGKIAYQPQLEFNSAAVRSAFSDAAIGAVLEVHPHAFNETAPA